MRQFPRDVHRYFGFGIVDRYHRPIDSLRVAGWNGFSCVVYRDALETDRRDASRKEYAMTHQDTAAPRQTPLRGERDGRPSNASGSTKAVIDEHIQRFRQGDLTGILDDYSEHAVMFTPFELLKGRSEIKTFVPGSAGRVCEAWLFRHRAHRDFRGRLRLPRVERGNGG